MTVTTVASRRAARCRAEVTLKNNGLYYPPASDHDMYPHRLRLRVIEARSAKTRPREKLAEGVGAEINRIICKDGGAEDPENSNLARTFLLKPMTPRRRSCR
jgi:hypothetical protein